MSQDAPRRGNWAVLLLLLGSAGPLTAAAPGVQHPNLLLNRAEIEQVKKKIKEHDWAAKLYARVKALADEPGRTGRNPREAALVYVLTGQKRYAEAVRQALVGQARSMLPKYAELDLKANPDFGAWGGLQTFAYAYDLTYEVFADEERALVEHYLRTAARTIIAGAKLNTNSADLIFGKHFEVGILGYCLGDKELIAWALNDPSPFGPSFGGFYQVLDANARDRYFWSEAPRYALGRTLQGMLALAEAARHYDGTDLYHYVSKKSGGSIKGLIDGYLRLAYPLEKTGIGAGSLRMVTFGDGSTAYSPRGELLDTFLLNPVHGGPKLEVTLNGELELAWKRYKDPGYAWLLSLNPKRDGYIDISLSGGFTGKIWGFVALTHGEPLPPKLEPPPAPSGVYPGQGIAVLHSDESPRYWTTGSTAAVLRLGSAIGHGHRDYFHLILHGKGRLLYPDLQLITYEPTYLSWGREGIGHNTLLVDGQSPRPCPFTTREDLAPEAKFVAITGSPFENVTQTRALLLTPDYLADVFHAADAENRPRRFDWVVHGLGRLFPGNPGAYRPTSGLVPWYWWVDKERGRTTAATWQADWVQHSGGVQPGLQPFGKEWFAQTAGVRLTMLGVPETEVHVGDGPMTDGPPYHRLDGNPEGSVPLVVARRHAAVTTFAAVHEPYDSLPRVRRVRRIQETDQAVGLVVESDTFSDRILVAFAPDKKQTLRSGGEAFTFRDHGYVRSSAGQVVVRGQVTAFRLRAHPLTRTTVVLNGKNQPARRDGDFLVFGRVEAEKDRTGPADDPQERRAAVHYAFLPEEVHLAAGGAKEVALHLRCVGQGEGKGKLSLTAPKGIAVEPAAIDLAGLREGDEKVVRLRVRAAADAANKSHALHIDPADGANAAAGSLPVSVGVVITEDRHIPLVAQSVIRAPGYTIKLDHLSGVCCFLLDADGHRRHGHVDESSHSYLGIGAVQRDGEWAMRYRTPCRFVFDGPNRLIVVAGGNGPQVRLRYTFFEDRIVLGLVPPTREAAEYAVWLGDFDALGTPRHNGKPPRKGLKDAATIADWVFFPHPVHRHGLLVIPPPKTALHLHGTMLNARLKVGQEVALRFATAEEVPKLVKE